MDLFDDGPNVTLYRSHFDDLRVDGVALALDMQQYTYTMYGQQRKRPRLERWFAERRDQRYGFGGGDPIEPVLMRGVPLLAKLCDEVEQVTGERFDSCFANLYRDGRDSIDWHADDDDWIGPVIASLSFGAARLFQMRRKPQAGGKPGPIRDRYELGHGDLLVMWSGVQDAWLHRVPKTATAVGPRLNLTFRQTAEVK